MLIEWTDLKPGDIVELNPEFLTEFYKEFRRKPRFTSKSGDYMDTDEVQFFVIKSIEHRDTSIKIELDGYYPISLTRDTGAISRFREGPSLLRVIALAEDQDVNAMDGS